VCGVDRNLTRPCAERQAPTSGYHVP
jgi:hypothetical protein